MNKDTAYYKRSVKQIKDLVKEHQEEIDHLRLENKTLKEDLHQENKKLKGRLIRLENTLHK